VGELWREMIGTFDSDELDHDDTETETFVCTGLKLHLSCYSAACDIEWV
jgi:hypothetical protein